MYVCVWLLAMWIVGSVMVWVEIRFGVVGGVVAGYQHGGLFIFGGGESMSLNISVFLFFFLFTVVWGGLIDRV